MQNIVKRPLREFPIQAATDFIDIPRDFYIMWLECRVTGTVDIAAGGGNDGALTDAADHVARLIDQIGVEYGTFNLIDSRLTGRDFYALNKWYYPTALPQSILAGVGVQAATPIEFNFIIPFSWPWLVNGINTALPPLPGDKPFRLRVRWNTTVATAGDSQGSGALITGGDRAVTLSDVKLSVVAHGARRASVPWFLPILTLQESRTFSAAEPRLPFSLDGDRLLAALHIQALSDTDLSRDDFINAVSFITGGERPYDDIDFDHLTTFERGSFPAKTATFDNEYFFMFADGGKLTNAIRPRDLQAPELQFDVSAPAGAPGVIRGIRHELISAPGLTQLPAGIRV